MEKHIEEEEIVRNIIIVRDKKVMLDQYLAELYKVDNKQLKRQVRRNLERFPEDFMFELTFEEIKNLRCQFGTSSWGGTRYTPMAFTEQGVAMLSSVLKSKTAIEVNVKIMRIFVKIRELMVTHKEILLKLDRIEEKLMLHENKHSKTESEIEIIFKAIKKLLGKPNIPPMKKIGYKE